MSTPSVAVGAVEAVLFDRDGTLLVDVPYNGDPGAVVLRRGAGQAVAGLRALGLRLGVVTNQSGVGRGLLTAADVEAVNRRMAELLGGLDVVVYCPHGGDDGCACRKPRPGLVLAAAAALDVELARCVVVGDILTDVLAGLAAGCRTILVPNEATDGADVAAAPTVAADLGEASRLIADWALG